MTKLSRRFILSWLAVCIAGLALCFYPYVKQETENYKALKYMDSQLEELTKQDTYLLDRLESFEKQTNQ